MGSLFKRKKKNGETRPIFQMKYKRWDPVRQDWSDWVYESTGTASQREAEALLLEIERREERRKRGLEAAIVPMRIGKALTGFLDETQEWDEEIPERNRQGTHPVLGSPVEGTAWWIRQVDFAADVFRCFGDADVAMLLLPRRVEELDRFLKRCGGQRGEGVGQTTRSKTMKWFRRFCRWCVVYGYLEKDPTEGFRMPSEAVAKQDRILDVDELPAFWEAYRKLRTKARTRIGLAMWTGARAGEIDTLRVDDVDVRRRTVRRRIFKKAEGAQERTVVVPEVLMEDLTTWIDEAKLEPGDMLFPVRCQAGVKFLRQWRTSMRGLRRTVLTHLMESGASLRVIQEAAGHSKLGTTQRYLGVGSKEVSSALAGLPWANAGMDVGSDRVGTFEDPEAPDRADKNPTANTICWHEGSKTASTRVAVPESESASLSQVSNAQASEAVQSGGANRNANIRLIRRRVIAHLRDSDGVGKSQKDLNRGSSKQRK